MIPSASTLHSLLQRIPLAHPSHTDYGPPPQPISRPTAGRLTGPATLRAGPFRRVRDAERSPLTELHFMQDQPN